MAWRAACLLVAAVILPACTSAPPWVEGDEAPPALVFAGQLAEGSAFGGTPMDVQETHPVPRPASLPLAAAVARPVPVAMPFQTPY